MTAGPSPAHVDAVGIAPELASEHSAIVPTSATLPRVHVVLCTYRPPLRHLELQIESILAQTGVDLTVTVVDDDSPPHVLRDVRRASDDPRVTVVTGARLGVFHNFERGLRLVPDDVDLILLSDQDDVWRADKAIVLAAALAQEPDALLVHSDARVVDDDGALLHRSMFAAEGRDVVHLDVDHLVLKNVVTGCTTALRPELLATALPFPALGNPAPFHHDLWLALCAASAGRVITVADQLQDYRQHGNNVMGLELAANRWKDPARAVADWRSRRLVAAVAMHALDAGQLPRGSGAEVVRRWNGPMAWVHLLALSGRWALRRDPQASFALLLAGVGLGGLVTNPVEAVQRSTSGLRIVRRAGALLLRIAQDPDARARLRARLQQEVVGPGMLPDACEPLPHAVRPLPAVAAPEASDRTLQVLVPYLPESGVFGGVATALRLAVELARQGEDVRVVETDKTDDLPPERLRRMLADSLDVPGDWVSGLRFTDAVREDQPLAVGPRDVFVATAWWTAHRAHWTASGVGHRDASFVYLVQDYEPSFYGGSDAQALAQASYDLPCRAVVNCATLAAHLRRVTDLDVDDDLVLVPQVDVPALSALPRLATSSEPLRVLLYGRPGVPRNLFETAVRGCGLWASQRGQARPLEVVSAGEDHPPVDVGNGVVIRSLGQLSWQQYEAQLATSHLGLSLMLSPHPSYPPLEMAAAGLVVVTNHYADKDLSTLSPRFVSCTPTSFDVARALAEAERRLATLGEDEGRSYDTSALGRPLDEVATALRRYLEDEAAPPP